MRRPVPWLIEVVVLFAYAAILMMLFALAIVYWVGAMAVESWTYAAWMTVTGIGFLIGRWSLFHFVITDERSEW